MQDTSSSSSLTTSEEAWSRWCPVAAGTQEMRATVCASCCCSSSRCKVGFLVILAMGALAATAKTLNKLQRCRTELFSWRFLICHLLLPCTLFLPCPIANLLSLSNRFQQSVRSVEHIHVLAYLCGFWLIRFHLTIFCISCHLVWQVKWATITEYSCCCFRGTRLCPFWPGPHVSCAGRATPWRQLSDQWP